MEEFFNIVSTFGFPMVLAVYLLFRFEKKLEALEATNRSLVEEIKVFKEEIKDLQKIITNLRRNK
jgi:cell division protein FtsB